MDLKVAALLLQNENGEKELVHPAFQAVEVHFHLLERCRRPGRLQGLLLPGDPAVIERLRQIKVESVLILRNLRKSHRHTRIGKGNGDHIALVAHSPVQVQGGEP